MISRKAVVTAIVALCVLSPTLNLRAHAQVNGETKVYKTEFIELDGKVQAMSARVQQDAEKKLDPETTLNLREEIFALVKLTTSLRDEANRTNLDILKRGENSNKTLLLISQGCEGLSFVMTALDNFLDTQDRAFLGFAKDGQELVGSIRKIL